jgi:hypothetical protein
MSIEQNANWQQVDPAASLFEDDSELTELVELPSKGLLYPKDHPLYHQTEIELRYPKRKDQEILTNQSYIRKGDAIDMVLQRAIVDKPTLQKFHTLLQGDKAAMFLAVKIMMHGPFYQLSQCPICDKSKQCHVDLRKIKARDGMKANSMPEEGIVETDHEQYGKVWSFPLQIRKHHSVTIRLLTSADQKKLYNYLKMCEDRNIQKDETAQLLRLMIVAYHGHDNPAVILQAIDEMYAKDALHIIKLHNRLKPDMPLEADFNCNDCGKDGYKISFPMLPSFFRPEQ